MTAAGVIHHTPARGCVATPLQIHDRRVYPARMRAQTSIGFGQRSWWGARDPDDCWVLAGIAAAFASTPWVWLPSVPSFRKAASDPDDGSNDGGDSRHRDMRRGVVNSWPMFRGKLAVLDGAPWAAFASALRSGKPAAFGLMPGKLPPRLQHGINNVPHECVAYMEPGSGDIYFWNPWNNTGERWDRLESLAEIKDAILAYGVGDVHALIFPTPETMLPFHPGYTGAVKAIKDENASLRLQVATLTTQLADAKREAANAWNAAIDAAQPIVTDAASKVGALRKP